MGLNHEKSTKRPSLFKHSIDEYSLISLLIVLDRSNDLLYRAAEEKGLRFYVESRFVIEPNTIDPSRISPLLPLLNNPNLFELLSCPKGK